MYPQFFRISKGHRDWNFVLRISGNKSINHENMKVL